MNKIDTDPRPESEVHTYYPHYLQTGPNEAQFTLNTYDLSQAAQEQFCLIVSIGKNTHIIVPQEVDAYGRAGNQVQLIGKGDIQSVEIPANTLFAQEPCTQCGAPIQPVYDAPEQHVISCDYCATPNKAEWTRDTEKDLVQVLLPWRHFNPPLEGEPRDVLGQIPDVLHWNKLIRSLTQFGEDTPVRVYTFRDTTRLELEQIVAVSVGQPEVTGRVIQIPSQTDMHKVLPDRRTRLRPAKEVMRIQDDLKRQEIRQAELRIADQLDMVFRIINDTTGKWNPVAGNRSLFDELLDIHKRYTDRSGTAFSGTSTIPLFHTRTIQIESVFDMGNLGFSQSNMLYFSDLNHIEYVINPRKLTTFEDRRRYAQELVWYGARDFGLPAHEGDSERIQAFIETAVKNYQEALKSKHLPGWHECDDFRGFFDLARHYI